MLSAAASHLELDHVGVLVADFEAAVDRYSALLGGGFERYDDDEGLDCRWARLTLLGGPSIELVAPRSSASPYRRDLERRGEGLHHVSFRVPDVIAERDRLNALGLEVLGLSLDHAGWQELFVHPRQTSGALMHFCVPPPQHA